MIPATILLIGYFPITTPSLPRHEIARVSELLQSQLLQPINTTPIQPNLGESNLLILDDAGPSSSSFNEFHSLFTRNRLALQLSGVLGNHDTYGNEVTQSGIWNNFSYSIGHFHLKTDGFRENNDLQEDIYNIFMQGHISPKLGVQTEIRRKEIEHGDRNFNFDLSEFDSNFRRNLHRTTGRVGVHYTPTPKLDLLWSGIYVDEEENQDYGFYGSQVDHNGYIAEVMSIFHIPHSSLLMGGGYYHFNREDKSEENSTQTTQHGNAYVYAYTEYPKQITWVVGASFDSFKDDQLDDVYQINPKLGLIYSITSSTTLRLAAFRQFKRTLIANTTIEPTHIAGFNQFFDDFNATGFKRFGVAIDKRFSPNLYSGFEISKRYLDKRILREGTEFLDDEENLYRAYLYWVPHPQVSIDLEYQLEDFNSKGQLTGTPDTQTLLLPCEMSFFHPSGFFSRFGATYVKQDVDYQPVGVTKTVNDKFVLLNTTIGYRLPKRYGIVTLQADNLLDKYFQFQGLGFRNSVQEETPPFLPERSLYLKVALAF